METGLDWWKDLSEIINNIIIALSIIFTAYWSYYTFAKRKEDIALLVNIEKIKPHFFNQNRSCELLVEVVLNNIGKRDLDLQYYSANFKISKTKRNNEIGPLIQEISGLVSHNKAYTGRLRADSKIKLPYSFRVEDVGMLFLEFKIDIDTSKHYRQRKKWNPSRGDSEIITWSDRIFYMLNKESL